MARLLASRWKTECGVCGVNDWRMFGDADGDPSMLILGAAWPDGAPVEDFGFKVLALACRNCGNIWMIAPQAASQIESEDDSEPQDETP